jgi:hypothetical protein
LQEGAVVVVLLVVVVVLVDIEATLLVKALAVVLLQNQSYLLI